MNPRLPTLQLVRARFLPRLHPAAPRLHPLRDL